MSHLLLCLLVLGLCKWKRWCLFHLLCLLPLGQGVRICWRLRWGTISLCAWGLWSVAYDWGTVPFCCCKQVGHVRNISTARFACEFAVWFGLCYFLIHWFFCLSFVCSKNGSSLALWVFDLIGLLGIGLLIIGLVTVGIGNFTLGVGISLGTLGVGCWLLVTSLGEGISLGGLAILSKVTCSVAGKLFSILSIICNASYSTIPLLFFFCFRAFVKSFRVSLLCLFWC